MKVAVEPRRCPQNHLCPVVRMCPAGAIKQNGHSAPVIDRTRCTDCGKCVRSCGYGAFRAA